MVTFYTYTWEILGLLTELPAALRILMVVKNMVNGYNVMKGTEYFMSF